MTFWRSGRFSHTTGFLLTTFFSFEGDVDGAGELAAAREEEEEEARKSEAVRGVFRSGLGLRSALTTSRRFLNGDLLDDEDGAGGTDAELDTGDVHSTSTDRAGAAVSTVIADAAVEGDDD